MWGISSWIWVWVSNSLVAGGLIGWGIVWSITTGREKMKRWLRKKRLLKNADLAISDAVWNYAEKNNPALIAKWGGGSGTLAYKIFRMRMYVGANILPEISKWQDFFDQVLKMQAEYLQKTYEQEDRCKKEAIKNVADNSMSRFRIDLQISSEERLVEDKKYIERRFWDLHDTLQYLGLKTWDSYKAYLKLKPMKDFPVLNQ